MLPERQQRAEEMSDFTFPQWMVAIWCVLQALSIPHEQILRGEEVGLRLIGHAGLVIYLIWGGFWK